MPVYLDCNATTPLEPKVADELHRFTVEEFGNSGSRTHGFGVRAKQRVNEARRQVAAVADVPPADLVFTSGATESNNLAILGLAAYGESEGRRHIISTQIEHKAVIEPLEHLESQGFEIDFVAPPESGRVETEAILEVLRPDTLLVSVMQVNNETGVIQPIVEIAEALQDHPAYFHVDAAQGFGKELGPLREERVDLISVSGHKVYAPKGIGALLMRRRGTVKPPLQPLMFGGGQEKGLRPGTLPVGLIAALGTASEMALSDHASRQARLEQLHEEALSNFSEINAAVNGDPDKTLPTTVNFSVPGLDSEAAIVALKSMVAISNGSACTSQSYEPSHVLTAMGLTDERIAGAIRLSWSHLTPDVPWGDVIASMTSLVQT